MLLITYDMRFWPVSLGVLIDDPIILEPEMRIPLKNNSSAFYFIRFLNSLSISTNHFIEGIHYLSFIVYYLRWSSENGECKSNNNAEVCPWVRICAVPHLIPANNISWSPFITCCIIFSWRAFFDVINLIRHFVCLDY